MAAENRCIKDPKNPKNIRIFHVEDTIVQVYFVKYSVKNSIINIVRCLSSSRIVLYESFFMLNSQKNI